MSRDRIIDTCTNSGCGQLLYRCVAIPSMINSHRVLMPDMAIIILHLGRNYRLDLGVEIRRVLPALFVELRQTLQLHQSQSRLYIGHAIVVADHFVIVAPLHPMAADHFTKLGYLVSICCDHSPLAAHQVFRRIETKSTCSK